MNAAVKWIGGASLTVALLVGAGVGASAMLGDEEAAAETAAALPASLESTAKAEASAPASEAPATEIEETESAPAPAQAEAAAEPLVIRRILPIEGPIKYGEWHWDDEGVPDGPLVMTVDLEARVLSVFKGGYEIAAAAVLLGTDEHPTPLGVFAILTKERHNVSEKYNNAPMPWTLRLTWDGVAIHGGSTVENGYASHGCIGVPDGLAAKLFEIAKKGDKVIITRGKTAGMGSPLI